MKQTEDHQARVDALVEKTLRAHRAESSHG